MSKRKKPDDEYREVCNKLLRVLTELPLDVLEKIAFELSFINAEKLGFRSDSRCATETRGSKLAPASVSVT